MEGILVTLGLIFLVFIIVTAVMVYKCVKIVWDVMKDNTPTSFLSQSQDYN